MDDESAIRQLIAAWVEATRLGQVDQVLSMMTPDVVSVFRKNSDGAWQLARDANLLVPVQN
jgi:ketosteroid isomerase-like protein